MSYRNRLALVLLSVASSAFLVGSAWAQSSPRDAADAPHGTVQRITVHGRGLEGNLLGDSPDRNVSVYLPPSYAIDDTRRYPVVYLLHGYGDEDAMWFGLEPHWINVPAIADRSLAVGGSQEMILVMPDANNRLRGSWFSNSAATGDWEDFVARDLVDYMDNHYRTLAAPVSRGLAGHSMGGYGAMRIGMKHPEVFSSLYLLSPCCLNPVLPQVSGSSSFLVGADLQIGLAAEAIHTLDDFDHADFLVQAFIAGIAAWSPNPKNPPLYVDLPSRKGQVQPLAMGRLIGNAPLATLDQYVPNLRQFHGLAFDAGNQDTDIAAAIQSLDQVLTGYNLPHQFEVYPGDHISGVPGRFETKLLPFFSSTLSFTESEQQSGPPYRRHLQQSGARH